MGNRCSTADDHSSVTVASPVTDEIPSVECIFEMEQSLQLQGMRNSILNQLQQTCYEMSVAEEEGERATKYERLLLLMERLKRLQARIRFLETRETTAEDAHTNRQRHSSRESTESNLPRDSGAGSGTHPSSPGGCGTSGASEPATLSGVVLGALGDSPVDSGLPRVD